MSLTRIRTQPPISYYNKQQRELKQSTQLSGAPPFLERLTLEKPIVPPKFDIEGEFRNLCVKIPLLQAIRDIPILAKTIRDLCIKKPGRKRKQPSTIQVGGKTKTLISNQFQTGKYANPGNPIVTAYINNIPIPNTLIDQGAVISIMTINTMKELQLSDLKPTQTILELVDRYKLKPEGIIDDVMVTIIPGNIL